MHMQNIRALLNLKTWHVLFLYINAVFNMVSHDYKKAIQLLNKCLSYQLPPNVLFSVYEQLGKCYADIGDDKNGESFLLRAMELDTEPSSEIYSRLGFIYFNMGRAELAKNYLEKALVNYNKRDYTNINLVKNILLKLNSKQEK